MNCRATILQSVRRTGTKHEFTIIMAILAGAFVLFAPAFAGQEDPTARDGADTGVEKTAQFLSAGSWIRGWGEPGTCLVSQVAVDRDGKIYVAGELRGAVDLDPGPGVDEHVSSGDFDFYVSKFDSSGDFLWARTWGGPELEIHLNVALDGVGGVYLAGDFSGSVDFDPGTSVAEGVSNGETDIFLSKLDSDGDFVWVGTWGGEHYEFGCGVAADDSGQVYTAGTFRGAVDFDPGLGITTVSPDGNGNGVFLSKLNPSGEFQWVRAWGGATRPGGLCDDVYLHPDGDIYVAGDFSDTTDFDPGDGIEQHTSNGGWDIFLSKFDNGGTFQWARTWGGYYDDMMEGLAVDSFGNTYVSAACSTTGRTFDAPVVGDGADQPSSECALHMSLAAFDSSGSLRWAREWGGLGIQFCPDLAVDASGNIYVSENYQVVGGLDPGSRETDVIGRFANSVVRFDFAGRFLRYCALGDIYGTGDLHLAVDSPDTILIAGSVSEIGDFDRRLLGGDYEGSPDPGAFLIRVP